MIVIEIKMEIIFKNLSMDILLGGSSFPLFPDRIGMWDFGVSGKPEDPEEETRSKDKNQQQTQPTHVTPSPGVIEPRPQWWEASALTAVPLPTPQHKCDKQLL